MNDVRLAFRSLLKSPGFAAAVILTLALCIGANSAIFSIVHAVLLRPFPFPESDRLVYVNNSYPRNDLPVANVSIPDYLDRIERAPSLESAMLYSWENTNLSGDERPTRVAGIRATPSMFATLRVAPALGRPFDESHAEPGDQHVVVLSHALWQDRFGMRDEVIGETIRLNGVPHTVIGVMPQDFYFPDSGVRLWTPFAFRPEQRTDAERGNEHSWMLARLKPGSSREQVREECDRIIAQNLERMPEERGFVEATGFTVAVQSMLDVWVADARPMLLLIQAGVIAALLIGCANVANLLLTRAIGRERELAIRTALGAPRWHVVRHLAIESIVLFAAGGGLGILVAGWCLDAVQAAELADLPRGENIRIDRAVLLFTVVSVGVTGLVFGLLPAWKGSLVRAAGSIHEAGTRTTAGRRSLNLRHGLVMLEVALSVMLLTTAGLLFRSFQNVQEQSPGFDATSVLTARLTMPEQKYPDDPRRIEFARRVVEAARALPGVESAGFTDIIPFGYHNAQVGYGIAGRAPIAGQPSPHGQIRSVSPGYFEAMRIPLLRGREFTGEDGADGEQVVVIDRVLADRHWPGQDPIGQFIYRGEERPGNLRRIVGVVATVKHTGLDDPATKETLYFPYAQRPVEGLTLVLRTSTPPGQMIRAVRQAVLGIDPEQPIFDIQTLDGRIDGKLRRQRMPMQLISAFGLMALVLAALGVYGVLAFNVGQRTQEFGIRSALGATARDVVGLVIRQGLVVVLAGVVIGIGGYLGVSRLLEHLVFGITPLDPIALTLGPVLLLVVATLACWIPARRATKVDPLTALRSE